MDLGRGESPHDSAWVLDDDASPPRVFCGDLVVDHMHCYLADGFHEEWPANLRRARRELPGDASMYMGHGKPGAASALVDWTDGYVEVVVDAVRQTPPTDDAAAFAAAVTRTVRSYLPGDDLLFLMQLSIEPLRRRLHTA